jgi:hypothetical protein
MTLTPTNPHAAALTPSYETRRFEFRFTPIYRAAALLFGVTPGTAWADVTADSLAARFGPWTLQTPLLNITDVELTGPYAVSKTAGPARLAITDRGLSFTTNADRGVLLTFRRPVAGIAPFGLLRHPELTITVAETQSFVDLLKARGATSLSR